MRLDRLEIFGFKSFAKRTQMRFSSGVTAVVGPNGCGKSNIADAIRWALGEQNIRTLRGKSLEDVIFNGTREAKPAGMAEIVLHLDNQDQRLATEFSQVAIQRRTFRSGESEFLINKAACRLKDIRSLFMDTGLGSSQYAVIEREMIDEVLSDRDDARRFLLDEASGITRYKQRRKETLRKIDAVEHDLTRVEDVLEIEERQVRSLAYQMGKARRYARLSDRIQTLDVALARLDWQAFMEAASGESGRLKEEEKRRELLQTALHGLEARQENWRLDLLELGKKLSAAREELTEADAHLSVNREETLVRKERQRALEERTVDLAQRIRQGQEERRQLEQELTALLPQLEALSAEQESSLRASIDAEKQWSHSEARLKRSKKELSQHQQIHIEQVQRRSMADQQIQGLEGRLAELEVQEEKTAAQLEALEHRTTALSGEMERLGKRRNRLDRQGEALKGKLGALEEKRSSRQGRIQDLSDEVGQLTDEAARAESRLNLLREQARTHEGFGEGVAQLLAHRDEVPGVIGVATELLAIDPEWGDRLAPALRGLTEWVVTKTENSAWEAIEWLRGRGLGQVTFVPLQELSAALRARGGEDGAPGETAEQAGDRSAAARAGLPDSAIVPRCPEAEPLAIFLRRTLIPVDDPSEIDPVSERAPGRKWITRSGDVVASEGWVGAGGGGSLEQRLWNRPDEIELLQQQLNELAGKLATLQEERGGATRELEEISGQIASLHREQEECALEMENISRAHLQKQAEVRLLGEETARLQDEGRRIAERRDEVGLELNDSQEDRTRVQAEEGSADALFRDAQHSVEQAAADRDDLGQRLSERKMEVLWTETRLKELQGRAEQRRTEIREAGERTAAAGKELELTQREISEMQARITELIKGEGDFVERREACSSEVDRLALERTRQEDELTSIEKELREKHHKLSGIEGALRQDEVQLARFEADRQRLLDRIQGQYGIDLSTLAPLRRVHREMEGGGGSHEGGQDGEAKAPMSPADQAQAAAAAALGVVGDRAASGAVAPEYAGADPLEGMTKEEALEALAAVRRDRDRLGPVNPLAIEEYEAKREHVRFVKSQRDDLMQSRESLLAAIERVNVEARRLFEETFTSVQENFGRTFGTLFPGGEAKLRLAGDDPLEADIEIVARPRGKRLTSIHLLSSGERALTATALLFGLYLVKPSPFCVLDEVDAPLDDANIDRFLTLLRTFSEKTQFIVITHNKRTMEVADTLYGVTMQEPGISKIVSVRMEGGEPVAEDRQAEQSLLPEMPGHE